MATLGDGNSWRQNGDEWAPWQRADVGASADAEAEADEHDAPLTLKPGEQPTFNNFPRRAARRAPKCGTYCAHNPPCRSY